MPRCVPGRLDAAATAAVEQSKTNSPKINRRRRGSDSRAPLARARMGNDEQRGHVVCCDRRVGEADPLSHNAAATAAVEQSKTNSPKINRRRRGSDSRAPLGARARMGNDEQRGPYGADLSMPRVGDDPVARGARRRPHDPSFAPNARAPAFAPNRISLKWNRRRRPAGGASGSPMDKEERERGPMAETNAVV